MLKALLSTLLAIAVTLVPASSSAASSPQIIKRVSLTGQTADIPMTTLFTPNVAGLFRISIYGTVIHPASSYGCSSMVLEWNDGGGSQSGRVVNGNQSCPNFLESDALGFTEETILVRSNAGTPVSYTIFSNAPGVIYDVFITVERLQ